MTDSARADVRHGESHQRKNTPVLYPQSLHSLSPAYLGELLERVERIDGHWLWTGNVDADGYGVVHFDGRQWKAHRLVWIFIEGPVSADEVLHHECRVKRCVFPGHLRKFGSNGEHISHEWAAGLTKGRWS